MYRYRSKDLKSLYSVDLLSLICFLLAKKISAGYLEIKHKHTYTLKTLFKQKTNNEFLKFRLETSF